MPWMEETPGVSSAPTATLVVREIEPKDAQKDRCRKCNQWGRVFLGRQVACSNCHEPVAKDDPEQVALDEKWTDADRRAKEDAEARVKQYDAQQKQLIEDQRHAAALAEKAG